MKWWQWVIVGFVALGVIGAITGNSEKKGGNATAAQTTASESAPAEQSATPAAPEPEPVLLSVQRPGSSGVVFSDKIVLRGTTTRGARVTVDGHDANVQKGHWTRRVTVHHGANSFDLSASKTGMVTADDSVSLTRKLSAAERAARQAARERKRQLAREKEAQRIAALTQTFSGSGSKNIGGINVTQDSLLEWVNNAADPQFRQMLIYDDALGISVSSDAGSGDTFVPAGHYKNITVAGSDSWTIRIHPK